MNSVAIIAFTERGCLLGKRLAEKLGTYSICAGARCVLSGPSRYAKKLGIDAYESLEAWTSHAFRRADAIVFVGASGIAVRAIAPHVADKFSDPAVVSVDEAGRFAVPLLSGHVGGANDLARAVAAITGGSAAISTATDVNGIFAVDQWAARNGLVVKERAVAKQIAACLLEGQTVGFAPSAGFDFSADLPEGVVHGAAPVGFTVSLDDASCPFDNTLHLIPRIVTLGVGCRKGVDAGVLRQAVNRALAQMRVSPLAVVGLATIDVKREECAIHQLAQSYGWNMRFYPAETLAAVPGSFSASAFVKRTVGVDNVCERAALVEGGMLMMPKRSQEGTTVALAVNPAALGSAVAFDGEAFFAAINELDEI